MTIPTNICILVRRALLCRLKEGGTGQLQHEEGGQATWFVKAHDWWILIDSTTL